MCGAEPALAPQNRIALAQIRAFGWHIPAPGLPRNHRFAGAAAEWLSICRTGVSCPRPRGCPRRRRPAHARRRSSARGRLPTLRPPGRRAPLPHEARGVDQCGRRRPAVPVRHFGVVPMDAWRCRAAASGRRALRDRAARPVPGRGRRAGDDVLPRSVGQRARVQGFPRHRFVVREVTTRAAAAWGGGLSGR